MRIVKGLLAFIVAITGLLTVSAPTQAASQAASQACRTGRVALTFDDGPYEQTPGLLKILRQNHAAATFFVQGYRARRYPSLIRQEAEDGRVVANHSWNHPKLTNLSTSAIRAQLRSTDEAIEAAGAPRPTLMRPPYGATNSRIRSIERARHLHEVLWTIDTTDWNYRTTDYIVRAALKGLRPHKSNIILMHDGVVNSYHSVAAVPRIIKGVRHRGYCLTVIGRKGRPANPRPAVWARPQTVTEGDHGVSTLAIPVTLSSKTVRNSSFRVRVRNGSAKAGRDFVIPMDRRIAIPAGQRKATINISIMGDAIHERTKTFRVQIKRPKHLRVKTKQIKITLHDNDAAPGALSKPSSGLPDAGSVRHQ